MVNICGYEFEPAPNNWDRLYGVDFYLKIKGNIVGVQIKPPSFGGSSGKSKGILRKQHRRFKKKYGARVFVITKDNKGNIINKEICSQIRDEIERLRKK